MINLHTLTILGFMPFADKQVIDLSGAGVVGVRGVNRDDAGKESNGSGKSAIFEALTFVLFDRTIRETKYKTDIISKGASEAVVTLTFSVGTDNYEITNRRTASAVKRTATKNGTVIRPADISESVFGGYDMFVNTVMFHGMVDAFSEWADADKKSFINRIIDVQFLERCRDTASAELSRVIASCAIKEGVLERLTADIALKEDNLKEVLAQTRDGNNLADAKQRAIKLRRDIKNITDILVARGGERDVAQARIAGRLAKYEAAQKALVPIKDNYSKANATVILAQERCDAMKVNLAKVKAGHGTECVSCGMTIDARKSNLTSGSTIARATHAVKAAKDSAKAALDKYGEYKAAEERRSERLERAQGKYIALQNEVVSLAEKKKSYTESLATIEESIRRSEAIFEQTERRALALRKQVGDAKDALVVVQDDLKNLEIQREYYSFWVEGFGKSGIQSLLLDSVLPEIGDYCNAYLAAATDGSTRIVLSPVAGTKVGVSDRISLEVYNEVGGEGYSVASSGERKIVDLCLTLALRRFILSRFPHREASVVIFDELLESLDSESALRAINIIRSDECLSKLRVFLISHNENIVGGLDAKITVTKRHGKATIK